MKLTLRLKDRWTNHHISEAALKTYVAYRIITEEDYKEITGEDYGEGTSDT